MFPRSVCVPLLVKSLASHGVSVVAAVDLSAFVKYWLLFILADEVAVLKHMYSGTVHVEVLKRVVMRSSD